METYEEIIEKIRKSLKYDLECNVYEFSDGSEGSGPEVFESQRGEVSFSIPGRDLEALVRGAITNGSAEVKFKARVTDRKGSPGYPEYQSWESNIKQYEGPVVLKLELLDESPVLSYDLPEHHKHSWSGW